MKLNYLGHAAFEIILDDGRKIVTDPYEAGSYNGALGFDPIEGSYDIAVVSHEHPDHRSEEVVSRAEKVFERAGVHEAEGVKVTMLPTYHDESEGNERGTNHISIIEADGVRVAHFGDLGHTVLIGDIPELEGVDVVLLPVGGHFTIDAWAAKKVVDEIGPKLVIPMHFKVEKLGFPIDTVDGFRELMENVEVPGTSELVLDEKALSGTKKVVILDPAN